MFKFQDGTDYTESNGRADGNDGFEFYTGGRREDSFNYGYLGLVQNVKDTVHAYFINRARQVMEKAKLNCHSPTGLVS